MTDTLTVDDLTFELRRSTRRRTLELVVDREAELVILAPAKTPVPVMEEFVREKRFWLYTKLAEKDALSQPVQEREFVSGEMFPYLGRSYRLLLVNTQNRPLNLEQGRFRLLRSEADSGRTHFVRWYAGHAQPWLTNRMRRFSSRIGVEPSSVQVRDLGFRWGSCGKNRSLYFHWATITLPPSLIEYVLVHELVHLKERNHTPSFWQRVERAMPDYRERRRGLAERGGNFPAI